MIVMKENQDCNLQSVYQQIVEISKKYQVKKVVLSGSRARGTNMPKSDIDLAIYGCADFGGLSDSLNEDLWSLLKLDIINMDDSTLFKSLNKREWICKRTKYQIYRNQKH
jgi:predicted nucleotidyltransferase